MSPSAVLKKFKDVVWVTMEKAITGFHDLVNHTENIVEFRNADGALERAERIVNGILAETISYHPNGAVKRKTPYVRGQRHGRSEAFGTDEKLLKAAIFCEGEIREYFDYHDNGKLSGHVPCIKGKNHGQETRYDRNGKVNGSREWSYGIQHGKNVFLATNGYRIETAFLHGQPQEPEVLYNPAGQMVRKNYHDRREDYHPNACMEACVPLQDKVPHGEELRYTDQGRLTDRNVWQNGRRHGKSVTYRNDGSRSERIYENDVSLEPVYEYNKDNQLARKVYKDRHVFPDDDNTESTIFLDEKGEYHGYEFNRDTKTGIVNKSGCYYIHGIFVKDDRFTVKDAEYTDLLEINSPSSTISDEFSVNKPGDMPPLQADIIKKITHYSHN